MLHRRSFCAAAVASWLAGTTQAQAPAGGQADPQLAQLLKRWQDDTAAIVEFRCQIHVWDRNKTFNKDTESLGDLAFKAPNLAAIEIRQQKVEGQWRPHEGLQWTCNGKSLFEVQHQKRKLVEYPLPPARRQNALDMTPLPFLFRVHAAQLQQRFTIEETTTDEERSDRKHYLVAWPNHAEDARSFRSAEVILAYYPVAGAERLLPYAVKLTDPNGNAEHTYAFERYEFGPRPFRRDPWTPRVPFGYQKVVEQLK